MSAEDSVKIKLEAEILRLEKERDECNSKGLRGKALGISWKLEGLNFALDFVSINSKYKGDKDK